MVDEQLRELELLRCRLRRLLHVCAHGSGEDCAALQFGALTQMTSSVEGGPL